MARSFQETRDGGIYVCPVDSSRPLSLHFRVARSSYSWIRCVQPGKREFERDGIFQFPFGTGDGSTTQAATPDHAIYYSPFLGLVSFANQYRQGNPPDA